MYPTKSPNLKGAARAFHCDTCGIHIDRSVNAVKNLAVRACV